MIATARAGEPERYLAALLAPHAAQADLLAVAAFAAELARVPALVKEPMMGEVRLQWWRDMLAADGPTGHALADAVRGVVERHRLPLPVLHAMTEARAFDLYDDPMPDDASFRGYLDKTAGAAFTLALRVLGADAPAALTDHAGRAFGTTRLLVALPQWLARGRLPLPSTQLAACGCTTEQLLAGQTSAATGRLLDAVTTAIEADHAAAVRLAHALPRPQRIAVLPLATIPPYLAAIRKTGRNPLRQPAEISPLRRITHIARAHWLGL